MTQMTNPPKKIITPATLASLRQRFFDAQNSTTNSLRCSPRRLRLRHKGAPQPTRLYLRRRQLVLSSAPAVAHRLSPIAPLSRASATRAPSSWLAAPSRFRARAQRPTTHRNYSQAPVFAPPPARQRRQAAAAAAPRFGMADAGSVGSASRSLLFNGWSDAGHGGVVAGLCVVAASCRSSDAWPCCRGRWRPAPTAPQSVAGASRPPGLVVEFRYERERERHRKQRKKISRRCGCGWAAAAPLLAAVAARLVVAGGVCRSQLVVGGCDRLADCGSRPALRSAPAPLQPLCSAPPSRASATVGACRGHALPTVAATRDANAGALISRRPAHAEKNPRKNLAKDVRR